MSLPSVSVIVLNFNGIFDTKKCIKSLLQTQYPRLSFYVVDNGSVNNEAVSLRKHFFDKRLTILRFEKNLGFTGSNNKLLRQIKSKYVVMLNNDVVVTKNWLRPLIKVLEIDKKIAVVQPKIRWQKKKNHFDYAGASGGYIDSLGYPFTRGRVFETLEEDTGQYDALSDVFWASGAAMVVRRSIFTKVGYFDTRFFNYMEEIDLCYRINKAGYRIVCQPKSVVFHKGAATSSKNELKKRFWEHRNNLLMITKNMSYQRLLVVLPIRFFLEFVSIFYYLLHRRYDYATAVILSQFAYVGMAPLVLFERLRQKPKKEYNVWRAYKERSVVVDYFLLKKRTFSALTA